MTINKIDTMNAIDLLDACSACGDDEHSVDILLRVEYCSFIDDINDATGEDYDNLCNFCADDIAEQFELEDLGY